MLVKVCSLLEPYESAVLPLLLVIKAPRNTDVAKAKKINKLQSLCSLLSAVSFYLRINRIMSVAMMQYNIYWSQKNTVMNCLNSSQIR